MDYSTERDGELTFASDLTGTSLRVLSCSLLVEDHRDIGLESASNRELATSNWHLLPRTMPGRL
jgi:hypothetical protein